MSVTIDTTGDAILTAVRAFLQSILPSTVEVIAGMDNEVPMPQGDFVSMTFSSMERLSLNALDAYSTDSSGASSVASMTPWRIQIALEIFSPSAQQYAATVAGVLRSEYGADSFPAPVVPLFCADPIQLPFVTAGENWLQRWRIEFSAQVNETVTMSTDTAGQIVIGLAPIDQTFAP